MKATVKSKSYMREMVNAYRECALWSSTDDNGEPLDGLGIYPSLACEKKFEADCTAFLWGIGCVDVGDIDAAQMGHDFWLTRNGHGTGFWDRDLGDLGVTLTALSERFGTCDLYVSDKNEIEVM